MDKIPTDTLVRTIVLVVALLNQILTAAGKNPIPYSDDELYTALTTALTVAATLWAWWRNNSLTEAAQAADEVKDAINSGDITTEDVEQLLNTTEV